MANNMCTMFWLGHVFLPVWLLRWGFEGGSHMSLYLIDYFGYCMICYWKN